MTNWLIDTALFKSFEPAKSQRFRSWIGVREASLFLSAASLVEIEAAIMRVPSSQAQRAEALRNWRDGLLAEFDDRIYPIDNQVALRAGALLRLCRQGHPRHRFHDALLAATAQAHGLGLLTKREPVFRGWANIEVSSPLAA